MGNTTTPPSGEMPGDGTLPQTETVTIPPVGTGETPGTTTAPNDVQKEIESLKAALKKANTEAASHRHKAKELDDLKAQAEAEKLSESEKLQKALSKLQAEKDQAIQQAQELRIGSVVQVQALQAGIDPTLATRLIERAAIEFDESGSPTNIGDLLKALVKQYPMLAGKAAPTSGGATNPPRSASTSPQELSWAVITELQKNPEEYNRRNADGSVTRWLHQHPHRYGQR